MWRLFVTLLLLPLSTKAVTDNPIHASTSKDHHPSSNVSIIFADDTSGPHVGAMGPIIAPEGCRVMGQQDARAEAAEKNFGDLSLLQSMPGWITFLGIVRNQLGLTGNDWDNITVGDTEHLYKTNGVQSYWCPQLDNTTWSWDPISTCTEAYQFSPMSLEGTGEILNGYARATLNMEVETEIDRSKYLEFGSALELGGVIGAFGNEQMIFNEIRWRLTVGVQNSKTTSDSTTQEVSATVTSVKHVISCELELVLKICKLVGTGSIPVLASGWVWFHFPKKVKGHTRWAFKLEAILPQKTDRMVMQYLDAKISLTGRGNVSLICDGKTIESKMKGNGTSLSVLGLIDPTWPGNALTSTSVTTIPPNSTFN